MPDVTATVVKQLDTDLVKKIVGKAPDTAKAEAEANAYSKITIGTITRSYRQAPFVTAPTTHAGTGDGTVEFHFRDASGADHYKTVENVSTAYKTGTKGHLDLTDPDISALAANTYFVNMVGALTLIDAYFIGG